MFGSCFIVLMKPVRIRTLCEPLYSEVGHPSILPKQLFLGLLGEYRLA